MGGLFQGLMFLMALTGFGRRRREEPRTEQQQPGVPPAAFPPPGAKTFEPVTFGPVAPGGRRAGPAAAPGIQAELGPLEPAGGMQKGIPGVKRGAFPGWHAARAPSPYMVQRANQIMRDPSVPVGANVTEGDTQYRKRRSGGKTFVYVFVR